jgi:hypothetical protein
MVYLIYGMKQYLCDNCDEIFTGCQVFEGYIRILNVCSDKCYEENNAKHQEE